MYVCIAFDVCMYASHLFEGSLAMAQSASTKKFTCLRWVGLATSLTDTSLIFRRRLGSSEPVTYWHIMFFGTRKCNLIPITPQIDHFSCFFMLSLLSRCSCLRDTTCSSWCGVSRLQIVSQRRTNGLITSISYHKQQTSPRTPCTDAMVAVGDRWKLAQNDHKIAKIAWFRHLARRLKQRSVEVH